MRNNCVSFNQNGKCVCLNVKVCNGPACRFYKNKKQLAENMKKAGARIRSLDAVTQSYIAKTYYKKPENKCWWQQEVYN